ncbi:hypothetical protein AT984_02195 [Paucibacter sp. KCTC 42545]|nr:hypothetical protein AT984_02195 [Paucibacter sp. KCTC 42545]
MNQLAVCSGQFEAFIKGANPLQEIFTEQDPGHACIDACGEFMEALSNIKAFQRQWAIPCPYVPVFIEQVASKHQDVRVRIASKCICYDAVSFRQEQIVIGRDENMCAVWSY